MTVQRPVDDLLRQALVGINEDADGPDLRSARAEFDRRAHQARPEAGMRRERRCFQPE